MIRTEEAETPDEVLAERRTHEHARTCMQQMRERTASQRVVAGDPYAEAHMRQMVAERLASLTDDGRTPLFFGRIESESPGDLGQRRFYIGRRHIHDSDSQPLVIDWRAGVARPFYRASHTDPMGLAGRTRYGFFEGTLTSVEHEVFATGEGRDVAHRALAAEIERPRVGSMRDIVATIQPEQDELIRTSLDTALCIQGSPGTGKTAIGLHRAAFLLYEHRDRLSDSGVLFVGPNPLFMSYVSRVLPSLGERQVAQLPLEALVDHSDATATDSAAAARVKTDERMGQVLHRAVFGRVGTAVDPIDVTLHSRRFSLATQAVNERLDQILGRRLPYEVSKRLFRETLVKDLLRQVERRGGAGDFNERDVARALQRSTSFKESMKRIWPQLKAESVVFGLLTDVERLAACAEGVLSDDEIAALTWQRRPRGIRAAPWSVHDTFLIDEVAGLLDSPRTFGHIVVDEAQDLSAMQLRAIGRRCQRGSVTLLGDLAQATSEWAVGSWEEALAFVVGGEGKIIELPRAFRTPEPLLDLANKLLPAMEVDVTPAESVRKGDRQALEFVHTDQQGLVKALAEAAARASTRPGSVGVVVPPDMLDAVTALEDQGVRCERLTSFNDPHAVVVVASTEVKGLEFDHVVLAEPAAIAEANPMGLRELYIALTRAVVDLTVVQSRPAPWEDAGSLGI